MGLIVLTCLGVGAVLLLSLARNAGMDLPGEQPGGSHRTTPGQSQPTSIWGYDPIETVEEALSRTGQEKPDDIHVLESAARLVTGATAREALGKGVGFSAEAPVWVVVALVRDGVRPSDLFPFAEPGGPGDSVFVEGIFYVFDANSGDLAGNGPLNVAQFEAVARLDNENLVIEEATPHLVEMPTAPPLIDD